MAESIGKYELVERIGRGGMGTVYKARDSRLNRFVALKSISPDVETNDELRTRFISEAQACAGLRHQNIVTIYDVGEEDDRIFIVMELLEGQELKRLLADHVKIDIEEKVWIMIQLCDALFYAHSQGIIHRDVKPGNVIVQRDGRVKIIDFGIAKMTASTSSTRTGMIMGTLKYMSPEQVRGRADARSDQYSLGAVCYEMLAYRPPFQGDDPIELLDHIRSAKIPPLRSLDQKIPEDLAVIVERAIRREATDRFADLDEMKFELESVLDRLRSEAGKLRQKLAPRLSELQKLQKSFEKRVGSAIAEAVDVSAGRQIGLQTLQDLEGQLDSRLNALRRGIIRAHELESEMPALKGMLRIGNATEVISRCEAILLELPEHSSVRAILEEAREFEASQRRQLLAHRLIDDANVALETGDVALCLTILDQVEDIPPTADQAARVSALREHAERTRERIIAPFAQNARRGSVRERPDVENREGSNLQTGQPVFRLFARLRAIGGAFVAALGRVERQTPPSPNLNPESEKNPPRNSDKPTPERVEIATHDGSDPVDTGDATRIAPSAPLRTPPANPHAVAAGKASAAESAFDPTQMVTPTSSSQAQIVITESSDAGSVGRSYAIARSEFEIGRDAGCDLRFSDPELSRRHARVRRVDSGFVILDLGSTNGTFMNGRRIVAEEETPLFFGASIRIGNTVFTFRHALDTTLPDLTGHTIASRYNLGTCLRSSAKSAVYSADDTRGGKVAIKLLSAELTNYAGYCEDFEREARIAQQLQHPHICSVRDYGTAEITVEGKSLRIPYLCSTLMDGGNLADRLLPTQPIARNLIVKWMQQLSSALTYAHRQNMVHGNLKPTAVCFDAEENAYLTDFVSSVSAGRSPVTGVPAFMAPEQWDAESATASSDQFALAALAYLLVTGSRPFHGQNDPQQRARNFLRGPTKAHEEAKRNRWPDFPAPLSNVLERGLATDPQKRFESMEIFFKAFDSSLNGKLRSDNAPPVFLSYNREKSSMAARFISDKLKDSYGIATFVDTKRLDGAVRFPEKLLRAIQDCEVFVCLLAPGTLESRWVREEIGAAYQFGRPMIPVFQEGFERENIASDDPAVKALLDYDAILLLDQQNVYVDHAIADLVQLVKQTLATSN